MSDLISRQAVENITWEEPSYTDPLNVLTEVRDKVRELPSADIIDHARAIKEYCVNRVSHNPTMCDECPIYKVMCEPDISCPYHWDLPEGEKGGN